jgi:hypothetical protein
MGSKPRRSSLAREIALVLAVKFIALLVIWSVWFASPQGTRLDAKQVGASVYSSHAVVPEGSDRDAKS